MRKILIHGVGAINNNIFDTNTRDNYNRPYIYLKEQLKIHGYEFITSDQNSLDDVDFVFFNDYNSVLHYTGFKGFVKKILSFFLQKYKFRDLYKEVKKKNNIQSILFLWEAQAVMPKNWDIKLHNRFNKIMTWNDDYVDNIKYYKIYWPQTDIYPEIKHVNFNEKKLLVNISMNKFSNNSLELYTERTNSIKYFDKNFPNDFDLFGYGWNKKINKISLKKELIFNTYRGTVKNKWDVLPNYKFALCYENIKDTKGWVTEKIFDCFRCNCVPIYWGASNILDFVNNDTFIDRRNYKTNEDLALFINNISEIEYMVYIKNIKEYLQSDKYYKFLPENYSNTVLKQIN
jgi:hypothetical protein